MTDAAPHDRMQQMADYRTTCRFLVRSGKQGIAFGCMFLFLGVVNLLVDPLLAGLNFGLGALELLIGLRNRFSPSASGVILDGIMLILLGIWNLSSQAVAIAQGFDPAWFNVAFGAIVIVVGIQRIRRYPRVKAAFDDPPTEEQIAWFDDVVKEVQEAKPGEGDVVDFRAGFQWKGKRFGDTLIFVDKLDTENLIVDRRDMEWTDKGKALFGGRRLARLRIGERTFGLAEIAPEMLALLESWRNEGEQGDPRTESESRYPE